VVNKCGDKSKTFITDPNGHFSTMITRGCDYELTANRPGYFEMVKFISADIFEGNSELELILPMDPFKTGTVVELENIYYYFNKDYIRQDAAADLITLAELLNVNQDLTIELGAHTDARGTSKYNRDLSQRRAQSAMK
jgi:peptidoglycan-associated lipoprotein